MPRGEDLVARIGPNSEKIYQEMTSEFGESELEDLYNKLDTLAKKLEIEQLLDYKDYLCRHQMIKIFTPIFLLWH